MITPNGGGGGGGGGGGAKQSRVSKAGRAGMASMVGMECRDKNGAGDHKVAWNFHKFLVDGEGSLRASLKSGADPLGDEISAFAAGK